MNKLIPNQRQFFALGLSSFFKMKYAIIPPKMLKIAGNAYQKTLLFLLGA